MTDEADPIRVEVMPELKELIPRFLANIRNDLVAARASALDGDPGPARVFGHQLKGSGTAYGFGFVSRLGERIEEAAESGDAAAVLDLLDELDESLDRVEVVVCE